jgi:TP901 family phage tail tape measure protein
MADRREYELLFKLNAQLGGSYNSTFKQGTASLTSMQRELQTLNKAQGDISAYQKQQASLVALKQQYKNIETEMQQTGNNSAALKNKLIDKRLAIEKVSDSLNKLDASLRAAGVDTSRLTEESRRLENEYGNLRQRQEQVAESSGDLETTMPNSFGGVKMAGAAAAAIAVFNKVIDELQECSAEASLLETAIAKIETVAGEGANMGKMTDDMIALSLQTGKAATELSDASYEAISSGVAAENAANFTEKAAKLAVGGFTGTATAVDLLTTIINSYEKSVGDTAHISDVLIQTQNLGKTTVDRLASSMGMVIPTAAAFNTELEDISTAYALMTARGMSTERTTTYINSMLNELGDSSSDVSKALEKMTKKSFAELMKEGKSLGDVMAILGSSVKNDSTAFANMWGSQEAQRAALSLLNVGTEKYNETLQMMTTSAGAADSAYKIMADTSEMTQNRFEAAAVALQIAIGNRINPALNGMREKGVEVLEWLADLVTEQKTLEEQLQDSNETFELNADKIEATGNVAFDYIDRLEELEKQGLYTKDSQDEYRDTLEKLVTIMPDLSSLIDIETGKIEGGTQALRDNTKAWMENSMAQAYQKQFQEQMDAYAAKRTEYETAKAELNKLTGEYDVFADLQDEAAQKLAKALGISKETLAGYSDTEIEQRWSGDAKTADLIAKYRNAGYSADAAQAKVDQQQAEVDNLQTQLTGSAEQLKLAAESFENLTGIDVDVTELLGEFADSLTATAEDIAFTTAAALAPIMQYLGAKYPNAGKYDPYEVYVDSLPGFAIGTTNAPSMFIAGENGPELIVGAGGSTVYTAEETKSILGAGGNSYSIQLSFDFNGNAPADLQEQLRESTDEIVRAVVIALEDRATDRQRRAYA